MSPDALRKQARWSLIEAHKRLRCIESTVWTEPDTWNRLFEMQIQIEDILIKEGMQNG